MGGAPAVQSDKAACLDYDLENGKSLLGYRWSGESELTSSNLVYQS
jgi:hypothetical protein